MLKPVLVIGLVFSVGACQFLVDFDRDRISKADAGSNDAVKHDDAGKHRDIDAGDSDICDPEVENCSATCGNGVLEPGETCDPISNCPESCEDGNACSLDSTLGKVETCDLICKREFIIECINNDECCPEGCDHTRDTDCSTSCGNRLLEEGETCDPSFLCPTDCSDGNSCTVETMLGSAANCNVTCSYQSITRCGLDDKCCPAGCNANNDEDCTKTCGNGIVEPGETCDPVSLCPTTCDDGTACTIDTKTGSVENCNVACNTQSITRCINDDGCCPAGCNANKDNDCTTTCDNGIVEPDETCDPRDTCPQSCDDGAACTIDAVTGSAENCNVACSHQTITECQRNDGCCPPGCNAANDNDCSASCGNWVVEPGETCDPPSVCRSDCDDGTACTIDTMVGNRENCTAVCTHQNVTQCQNGDGCCPAGCNTNIDNDCSATCGNGAVEPGETCDPPSACPTLASCNDGNSCTIDTITGSAANCTAACAHQTITQCRNNDNCCPQGCDANNDNNCSPSCGNGTVEEGETCDPQSTCPTTCNDGVACTIDTSTGSAANCNAACAHQTITECSNGDGCCPGGCNANNDDDCSPTCDNGAVEEGETCDPPADCPTLADCTDNNSCTIDSVTGSAENCTAACASQTITQCGNGDSCCPPGCNANNDDACPANCDNGAVEEGETCDPPSTCPTLLECTDDDPCTIDSVTGSAENCTAACASQTITQCGNGDSCCPPGCNANNDNDCSATCNNGVVEDGETCDPRADCPTNCSDGDECTTYTLIGSAAECTAYCTSVTISDCHHDDGCCPDGCNTTSANLDDDCPPVCGNGALETGETCDPSADCPTSCLSPPGCTTYNLIGNADECTAECEPETITDCQDDDGCCPDGCNTNVDDLDDDCPPFCGNEVVEEGETCDPPTVICPTRENCIAAPCFPASFTGDPDQCTAQCTVTEITACSAVEDGCCPDPGDCDTDPDCPSNP